MLMSLLFVCESRLTHNQSGYMYPNYEYIHKIIVFLGKTYAMILLIKPFYTLLTNTCINRLQLIYHG